VVPGNIDLFLLFHNQFTYYNCTIWFQLFWSGYGSTADNCMCLKYGNLLILFQFNCIFRSPPHTTPLIGFPIVITNQISVQPSGYQSIWINLFFTYGNLLFQGGGRMWWVSEGIDPFPMYIFSPNCFGLDLGNLSGYAGDGIGGVVCVDCILLHHFKIYILHSNINFYTIHLYSFHQFLSITFFKNKADIIF
jgi:hypothetical protein